jgi:hypothetical protein
MRKLAEVQEAKDLMNEAMEWSMFKWLWEKSTVRQKADRANAALDRAERHIKAKWSDETKATYKLLSAKKPKDENPDASHQLPDDVAASRLVKKVLDADYAARRARMDAEDTFEEAEKKMSTALAREGCKKAIRSWELHEKAIRSAEALMEAVAEREH